MIILPNGIAVIEGDSHIGKWVEQSGRLDHDQNMLPVILPYIKEGDWVLDIGAFIGDHTIAYQKAVGITGRVFAFEANYEAYECLKHNCKESHCYNFAVGEKFGYVDLTTMQNKGATFGIHSSKGVPVTSIDSFSFPIVDFMKLDIEGMELEAIKGSIETILRCKPIILTEVNEAALNRNGTNGQELIAFIEKLGYSKKKVYESDTLEGPMFDLLFLPIKETV